MGPSTAYFCLACRRRVQGPGGWGSFFFFFFLGGPAPPEGRGGGHSPRDHKRIARRKALGSKTERLTCSRLRRSQRSIMAEWSRGAASAEMSSYPSTQEDASADSESELRAFREWWGVHGVHDYVVFQLQHSVGANTANRGGFATPRVIIPALALVRGLQRTRGYRQITLTV